MCPKVRIIVDSKVLINCGVSFNVSNSITMNKNIHDNSIRHTVTKVVQLCSVYQASSCVPNFTLLAWFLPNLPYLCMLVLLELACIAGSVNQLLTTRVQSPKPTLLNYDGWNGKLSLYDCVCYTEQNGPTHDKILQIPMKMRFLSTRVTFERL